MKKFNYILLGLACATSVVFAACEDKAEYNPAGTATASGVYFSNELASTVNLSKDATTFDVEICRGDASEDAAVDLTVLIDDADAAKLTIPTVAYFAKGSTTANITIGYDPTTLEYEDWIKVVLSITDESLHSPYAEYSYSFSAGIPAPYTKVIAENGDSTATYREDLVTTFWSVDNLVYDLEIRENDITPGIYRLMNPYGEAYDYNDPGDWDTTKDAYIEIDARDPEAVVLNASYLGCDWGYGEWFVWSLASGYMTRYGYSLQEVKDMGYTGTLKDGIITFPAGKLLFGMENFQNFTLYASNSNGLFAIALPGYELTDYTVELTYKGRLTAPDEESNFAVAGIVVGEDVESVRLAMAKTNDAEALIQAIKDGTVTTTDVNAPDKEAEDQTIDDVQLRLDDDGDYIIAAVTYAGGKARESAYVAFTYASGGKSAWKSLGVGLYRDDFITTYYAVDAVAYEVEVQESNETPGLYRMINPYGEAYPYNEEGDWDASMNYNIEINACDPEGVYIPLQGTGCDWGKYGEYYVYSLAANYIDNNYTIEDAKEAGVAGTLENGIITFPTNALLTTATNLSSFYYANTNGAFALVLPDTYATMSADLTSTGVTSSTARRLTNNTPLSRRDLLYKGKVRVISEMVDRF